jgi:signal transduction histidine kinase
MEPARSVLVVDDDAVVLRILADQIAKEGYVVASAMRVGEARRRLSQTLFGIVLADQTMPDTSGIDFLRECRASQPLASRILATGDFGRTEMEQALKDGEICRLLVKPWTRSELIVAFQQAYERHELLCEKEELRNEVSVLRDRIVDLTRQLQSLGAEPETRLAYGAEAELQSANEKLLLTIDELHHREQRVVQPGRLQALGKLVGSVAHDFNNALIPILGYIELMLERDELLNDREKARHYLRLVLAAAKEATRIASRFREFSGQGEESETPEPVDLNHAVSRAVSFTQPRWRDEAIARGKEIQVKVDLRVLPPVAGTEAEMQKVLRNLIFNAIDALPEGGSIEIRAFPESDQGAVLEIQDDGVGMAAELRERCLEPFVTTKCEHGAGLGLATVYGILERYNGLIEVESKPGEGSIFRLRLPFFQGAAHGFGEIVSERR